MEAEPRKPDLNTDRLLIVWGSTIPFLLNPVTPYIRPAFPYGGEQASPIPQDKLWLEVLPENPDPAYYPRSKSFALHPQVFVGTVHQFCVFFSRLIRAAAARGLQLDAPATPDRNAVWEANQELQDVLQQLPGVAGAQNGVELELTPPQHPVAAQYDALRERYRIAKRAKEFVGELAERETVEDGMAKRAAQALVEQTGSAEAAREILHALLPVIPSESYGRLLSYVDAGGGAEPAPEDFNEEEES